MRSAFRQAFKDELIDANPFDRIDRPKKNKFQGEYYTAEELVTLMKLTETDVIYPAIVLAGCMGLRRSEALGVRWSRIDWEKRTVLLDTKIVEFDENGHSVVRPEEEMKNKSSRRTLPITDPVYEMLENQKAKQELYRKLFKSSYIPHENTGQATHKYRIRREDVTDFMRRMENEEGFISELTWLFSNRTEWYPLPLLEVTKENSSSFRAWLIEQWQELPDALPVKNVIKLIGGRPIQIHELINNGTLNGAPSAVKFIVPSLKS